MKVRNNTNYRFEIQLFTLFNISNRNLLEEETKCLSVYNKLLTATCLFPIKGSILQKKTPLMKTLKHLRKGHTKNQFQQKITTFAAMFFSDTMIHWYQNNGRLLPWRESRNPYLIWLSEIILQQTRVEQGLPYYLRFAEQYPTVNDFAAASEDEILRIWQGLGYYSRARNMHKAAKIIAQQRKGIFPSSYDELIALPGIGEYTASAISSFAAKEIRAVVDGNVYRVLSRIFGIDTPINSSEGVKVFKALAAELIDAEHPDIYNQAIMDFGALQCKPKLPLCNNCPFAQECIALKNNTVDVLPVKIKKNTIKARYFHYFIITSGDQLLMSKRGEKEIWANLYEFPLIETETLIDAEELSRHPEYIEHFGEVLPQQINATTKHILSHQHIYATFYKLPENHTPILKKSNWSYIFSNNLDKLAKHKLIFTFLSKNVLF